MSRNLFLSITACVAIIVGFVAVINPHLILMSKGVAVNEATIVWVREVGILLIPIGILNWHFRNLQDYQSMKYFLLCNALWQLGLLPIEILAYRNGIITDLSGIIPNTALHLLFSVGYIFYYFKLKSQTSDPFRS